MKRKRLQPENDPSRLDIRDITRIDAFIPWWVHCQNCSQLAFLIPKWGERIGECKCGSCGSLYKIAFSSDHKRVFPDLPLWLKANFRGKMFWALNGDHLDQLERVIQATLRERPVIEGRRMAFTTLMPFNLPSWILSSKNRLDLLKLITRLRKTFPE